MVTLLELTTLLGRGVRPEIIGHMVLYFPLSLWTHTGVLKFRCSLSSDDYLFNDFDFPVCRWHVEILGWEDNSTQQVLTVINSFLFDFHLKSVQSDLIKS